MFNLFGGSSDEEEKKRKQEKHSKQLRNYQNKLDLDLMQKIPTNQQEINYDSYSPKFMKTIVQGKEQETNIVEIIKKEYDATKTNKKELIQYFPEENDYGNTEYKWKLVDVPPNKLESLTTQMKFRLKEGNGTAYYKIGVHDKGTPIGLSAQDMFLSFRTICTMSSNLKANIYFQRIKPGFKGKIAEIAVEQNQLDGIKLDCRVLLLGDQGSGKSTLIGVLTSGKRDDGKGLARMQVLNHKHEVLSGQTSSLSHNYLGFDSSGNIINHTAPSWEEIFQFSTKIFRLIDIGGQAKQLKTMVQALCSQFPDYALLVVSAQQGFTKISKKHWKLCFALQIPVFILISHIDLVGEEQIIETMKQIELFFFEYAKISGKMHQIQLIENQEQTIQMPDNFYELNLIPIIKISNTNEQSIQFFQFFLHQLPIKTKSQSDVNAQTEFMVNDNFEIKGTSILGGTVLSGSVKQKQILQFGPDAKGYFKQVLVKEIQCNRVPVQTVKKGQVATVAIKPCPQNEN